MKFIQVTSVDTDVTKGMTRAEFFEEFGKAEGKEILAGHLPNLIAVPVEFEVEFTEHYYEQNHGRTPRGHGSWAFAESKNPDNSRILWAQGTLAEAKKAVVRKLASMTPAPGSYLLLYILP